MKKDRTLELLVLRRRVMFEDVAAMFTEHRVGLRQAGDRDRGEG